MSHVQYVDELVKEYLLFRGFSQTLKIFDNESKVEKEKGFRVDKIVDQLMHYIYTFDIVSLRGLWGDLDTKIFSHLESHFTQSVKKLDNAILKMYLVNATINNKPEKVQEFFNRLTHELQGHSEWKDWFAYPFIKNPEENSIYSVYFNKQWQDTMIVSLHNFLSTIFQCMPYPTLLTIDEHANKIKSLQEENNTLRQCLNESIKVDNISDVNLGLTPHLPPIMDDFYIIAQESPLTDNNIKTFKNLIKNISSGSSPILQRKSLVTKRENNKILGGRVIAVSKGDVAKRSTSCDSRLTRKKRDSSLEHRHTVTKNNNDDFSYILLSQEEYTEHQPSSIIQCKSNSSGSFVATGDADGVLKIWTPIPSPKTVATFASPSSSSITALDWIAKNERYFLHGDVNGVMELHDIRDCKTLLKIKHEGSQIVTLLCNPTDSSTFVCSVSEHNTAATASESKILLYNVKTKKLERTLYTDSNVTALCSAFNHNGQLLISGLSNGNIIIHDIRRNEVIDNFNCHSSPIIDIELINDYTNIVAQAEDGTLCQRNLNNIGKNVWQSKIKIDNKNNIKMHGKMFTFDQTASHMLLCTQTGGSIYKVPPNSIEDKIIELGGHKGTLCCDWSTANQSGTCITGGAEGKARVSILLSP